MKIENINGCRSIDAFVKQKLDRLNQTDRSFKSLFTLMFSEADGVLYERSEGYKIIKTTYGEAKENALKRAAALRTLLANCPYDSVVGIYMENSVEWIETFWAVLAAGFRPLLLNLRLDAQNIHAALKDSEAVAVISDSTTFAVQTILQQDLIAPKADMTDGPFGTGIFVMSTGTSSHVKICCYGSEEFCCLVNDSVSIVKNCVQIKKHYNGYIKLLTFLPFYHVFGLIAMYIWFAFFSRSFVHLKNMEPQTILNTVRRHEVTHIFAVPLFWERVYDQAMKGIAQRGEKTVQKYEKGLRIGAKLEGCPPLARLFRKIAFKQVRDNIFGDSVLFMISGGSPIRAEALRFFNDIGYHLANGYGMTEIGITSVEQSMDARVRNSGSVGKPMDSVSYKINEYGELLVKGPSLAKSILQDGNCTTRGDDWFATGDLARFENGTYYIEGRRDDLILLANGEMLNPNLIEPQLISKEMAHICLINAGKANAPLPTLLVSVGRGCTKSQLEAYRGQLLAQLEQQKLQTHIKGIVFVAESLLAQNEFKLNRSALAKKYVQGQLATLSIEDAPAQTAGSELELQVAEIVASILNKPAEQIGLDADFFMDLEGTSLDYFALLSALKSVFNLPFAETDQTSFNTVREICRYIEGTN